MKTAVSIPNDVFEEAEQLAKRTNKSRSQVFADALREYLARHSSDEITDAMNRVITQVGVQPDEWLAKVSHRSLKRNEW